MKKQLLFAMMLMVSFFSFSQYKPLLEEGKVWIYCSEGSSWGFEEGSENILTFYGRSIKVFLEGFEELDGVTYHKLYRQKFFQDKLEVDYDLSQEEIDEALAQLPITYENLSGGEIIELMENAEEPELIGYLREDVAEKKVYTRAFVQYDNESEQTLSEEYVLYDFNMEAGSVFYPLYYCPDGVDAIEGGGIIDDYETIIEAKNIVNINGQDLIEYSNINCSEISGAFGGVKFIEGIGSTNSLLPSLPFESYTFRKDNSVLETFGEIFTCNEGRLSLVIENGEAFYNPSGFTYVNYILSTEDIELELDNIEVSPIPASDYVQVKAFQQNLSFELFDINGRKLKVFREKSNSDYSLNISHLEKGVYFLKITNDDNTSITKKIMKQ
ncbi:T9SS type A sorting domain-containing protein [Aureivirga sp. CE67]|uniref:T9SS type A sorting domain-containing protein n=1 Tax=Aureivirga sp. CE67 TaxID=1788983 RepID=UPI0018CA7E5D|nr:T9SS type A sorting domain-containing protein [Aureivirga sp. CE67]